jgi:glycine reductase complex component B subunit gamma
MVIVHYLNQFFAGLGGEDAADTAPLRLSSAVGPGKALGLDVSFTLVCGDDYFAQHEEEALRALLDWVNAERPDVMVLGPSFGSGRYGYACGRIAREVALRGVPAVCGMHPDSPGVVAAEGAAYILPAAENVTGMREVLPRMARLAERLAAKEPVGSDDEEGVLARTLRRNRFSDRSGAERAVDLLLEKMDGNVTTEVAFPALDSVPPPAPVRDMRETTLALVTEAGCVPQGNPDRMVTVRSTKWLRYPLPSTELGAGAYEFIHGGYNVGPGNADPNRLVPLDAVRWLQEEGRVGRLYDYFYTTMGNGTSVAACARFGAEIAAELREADVGAVILTGT